MYDKILVPVDNSAPSQRAVLAARDLARLSGGEVWVLHLREREVAAKTGIAFTLETSEDANAEVSAAVDLLTQAGVKAHGEVATTLYGRVAPAIADRAIEHDAGVIIMGSRGHGDLAGLVLGSTAHKVIHLSDRPVLIIR